MKKAIIMLVLSILITASFNTAPAKQSKQQQGTEKAIYKCPMHPEITSDNPGDCSKCGMKLEKAQMKEKGSSAKKGKKVNSDEKKVVYYCPMHPEVKSDKAGDCSKCGMHLEKKEKK